MVSSCSETPAASGPNLDARCVFGRRELKIAKRRPKEWVAAVADRGRATSRRGASGSRLPARRVRLEQRRAELPSRLPDIAEVTESCQHPSWTRQQRLAIPASMSTSTLGWG
jgi:hypothetical protein